MPYRHGYVIFAVFLCIRNALQRRAMLNSSSRLRLSLVAVVCCVLIALLDSCSRNSGDLAAPARQPEQPPVVDVEALQKQAEQGNSDAQLRLGRAYAQGNGVKRSYKEAAQWYRKAVDGGSLPAHTALGELYEAGQGVKLDYAEAAKLYRAAAEKGEMNAQYSLAEMLQAGRGIAKDHSEAVKWYRAAADQGDPLAQYNLAQRYELGVGVAVDKVEAYKWYTIAALNGQPDSAKAGAKLASSLNSAELAEAKKRAAGFTPRKNG
jgi:TPR repeat protein